MIRKTIIGLLVLATLGIVVLWAFAFFGGSYTTNWDLTDRIWCIIMLAPVRCEVGITRLPAPPELTDLPSELNEQLMELNRLYIAALREADKTHERALYQRGLSPRPPHLPTTFGFGWDHRVDFATRSFPGFSKWYVWCPSWALLALAGLLGTYPAVVFIHRPFRRARRLRNGWCQGCGYDLQGNVSGVCSECGTNLCPT